jgi:TatD DNase family protein
MARYIDIGANLTSKRFPESEIDSILLEAEINGVDRIIITGTTYKNSLDAIKMVQKYNKFKLYSTVGLHPHNAKEFNSHLIDDIRHIIEDKTLGKKIVALGECGLDYDRMFSPKDKQIECFTAFLELAKETGLPLFLHERDAFDDFYDIIKNYKGQIKGIVHCYTGTKEHVEKYLELGLYVGITGFVCHDHRNKDLYDALSSIPTDKLMIETDCPYMNPCNSKQMCYPKHIYYTAKRLAHVYGIEQKDLAKTLYDNTMTFFNLSHYDS